MQFAEGNRCHGLPMSYWIESHQSLSRHRKTLRAVAVLKVNRHKLIGHLHELWWWGLDNASSQGELGDVTPEQIADGAGWPLRDGVRFVAALVECGFLEHHEGGYRLHDWYDYAGKLNDQKELRRASNRESQQRRRARLSALTHADAADSQQSTVPNLTN